MFKTPGKRRVPNPFRDEEESLPICAPKTSSSSSSFTLKHCFICFILVLGALSLFASKSGVENVSLDVAGTPSHSGQATATGSTDDYLSTIPDTLSTPRPHKAPDLTETETEEEGDKYGEKSNAEPVEPVEHVEPKAPPPTPRPTPQPTPASPPNPVEDHSHGHHGHHNHALGTTFLKKFSLWLDASQGDTINASPDAKTFSWDDMNMGEKNYEFLSLSPTGSKSKLQKAMNEFKTSFDQVQTSLNLPQVTVSPYVPSSSLDGVTFPGPLRTTNFRPQYVSTLFFVVKPTIVVGTTSNVVGTEFFSSGDAAFSIDKGMVAFASNSKNKDRTVLHMTQSKGHVKADETIAVAYKLNGDKKMMSLNGSPFEEFEGPHVFSDSPDTFLGGSAAGRSFVGDVKEVILLDSNLDDDKCSEVLNYLAKKWDIIGMPDDVNLRTDTRLVPTEDAGSASESIGAGGKAEHKNPKPDELTELQKAELKKREEEAKAKADKVKKAEWLEDLDKLHEKAVAEAKEETEKHIEDMKKNAPQNDANVEDMWTIEKAKKFVPGPCKGSGDSFKGAPLKVWDVDKQGNYVQVMWPPPASAEFEDINKYTDAYNDAMQSISSLKKGGDRLKKFVHSETTKLKELRHKLFCADLSSGDMGGLR
ncbi:hypothetical protein TrST_g12087 [Triparma strigata]|uniref:Uncharacterized protein n=1 Tax=Triparma strigata TaxID=1606541 RepID=A0A9W7EWK0_9STRA|nr:hypothetical protein TrST_g12087 [Triparma strigata]